MDDLNDEVQKIGREYVEQRKSIEEQWMWEFDTERNRSIKQQQIDQVEREFREKLRHRKIEHILNDTVLGRQI
jgi:hypothetical protein